MSDAYTDDENGLQATALGLLNSWPDLRSRLSDIYQQRVDALDFVPFGWLQAALDHLHAPDGAVWVPQPHPTNPPEWLQSSEAQAAWKSVFDAVESAVQKYAAEKADEGALELAYLQANATFWDGLYRVAVVVRDAPGTVLEAAGTVAGSIVDKAVGGIWSSGTGKVLLIGAVVALGAAIYFLGGNLKRTAVAGLGLAK